MVFSKSFIVLLLVLVLLVISTFVQLVQSQPPTRKAANSWTKYDKEKAETFATHLDNVFSLNNAIPPDYIMSRVSSNRQATYQLNLPLKKFPKSIYIRL